MVKRNLVSPLQNVELFQNLNALFDMFENIFLKNFPIIFFQSTKDAVLTRKLKRDPTQNDMRVRILFEGAIWHCCND